jgi:hypothetical protein
VLVFAEIRDTAGLDTEKFEEPIQRARGRRERRCPK